MGQWSQVDRTLYAKIVYYGPALGGKTTNLRALHQVTDPDGANPLLSLATADDRTLFFDLLPFELGSILGYKVAIKLYTVPGQIRYAATRRVVLSGADAVVYVADSSPDREADNRSGFEDLRRNMLANRLDPARVPVLLQLNKRDVPGAVREAVMQAWFSGVHGNPWPAIAIDGKGVLETLMAACKAMLEKLAGLAERRTREDLNLAELHRHIERAFPTLDARPAVGAGVRAVATPPGDAIVLDDGDLVASAVRSSVALGEELVNARATAARLDAEAAALRRLSEAVRAMGSDFDRAAIVSGALSAARDVLGAPCVSVFAMDPSGSIVGEACSGRDEDPLLASEPGRNLARRLFSNSETCVLDGLAPEVKAVRELRSLRALAAVPFEGDLPRRIVAWAVEPKARFDPGDVRFLETLVAHLAVALDRARLYAEVTASRDRLEVLVDSRTTALRAAYDELHALEQTKDRFLSNVSHEMRTPLTAVVSAATFLRSYEGSAEERREMTEAILHAGRTLQGLVDGLLRIARLEERGDSASFTATSAAEVLAEAAMLARRGEVSVEVDSGAGAIEADLGRLAHAVANLIDNAAKFSPPGSPVEVRASACTLRRGSGTVAATSFTVLDRGPGIPEADLERVFAPFEQGGAILTDKPTGVGLGLYEARVVARRHGGTLHYRPRPGGGSEFRLVVPEASEAGSAIPFDRAGRTAAGGETA